MKNGTIQSDILNEHPIAARDMVWGNNMNLLYKHLIKQVGRNKVFVVLLFILTCLASLSYFFVKFSVDGNLAMLDSQALLSENQKKYRDALLSNTNLAYIFFFAMTILTAFVFIMFLPFFRSAKNRWAV